MRAFIVAGGPSVAGQNTDQLKGEHVIAINSSWERVPFAEILFFADDRWWNEYGAGVLRGFAGRIITCASAVYHQRLEKLNRRIIPGLSDHPREVMVRRTSLTGAINLAVHMGFREIVLLGADGAQSQDGRMHHHAEYGSKLTVDPARRPELFREQLKDLEAVAIDLKRLGISAINASPGSALDIWPVTTLDEALSMAIAA